MKIKTVKSGQEYRAALDGHNLTFMLSQDGNQVLIHDKHCRYGGYNLDRFGGQLTPKSIREFVDKVN